MADVNDQVMTLVEAELKQHPEMASGELFEKAKAEFPSIGDLTLRQFHARYPLQVKRRASMASGSARKPSKRSTSPKRKAGRKKQASRGAAGRGTGRSGRSAPADRGTREAIRAILMRFATELASAEAKADVVKVLAGADRYVDDVVEAAGA